MSDALSPEELRQMRKATDQGNYHFTHPDLPDARLWQGLADRGLAVRPSIPAKRDGSFFYRLTIAGLAAIRAYDGIAR